MGERAQSSDAAGEEVEGMGEPSDEFVDDSGPRFAKGPSEPTRAERERHELTHLPPRSWCAHCRRGRFITIPHWSSQAEKGYPIISIDYAYLGTTVDQDHDLWKKAKFDAS